MELREDKEGEMRQEKEQKVIKQQTKAMTKMTNLGYESSRGIQKKRNHMMMIPQWMIIRTTEELQGLQTLIESKNLR